MSNPTAPAIRKPTDNQAAPARTSRVAELEIDVVYTTYVGTRAALQKASELSRDLGTGIRLIAPQAIPYAYSIERPPISFELIRRKMVDLVLRSMPDGAKTTIDLYLCRDRMKTLLNVLKPNSLVIVGGKRRLWATHESRMAKALRRNGHQVLSIDL